LDENNTFQFYSSTKTVGATVLDGLWAWHLLKQTCAAQEAQKST